MRPSRPFGLIAAVMLAALAVPSTAAATAPVDPPASGSADPAVTVLAPLGDAAPVPTAATTAAALAVPAAAAALGGGLVGEVLDGDTGSVLWSKDPDRPLLVASAQKLLVSAAALDVLGPGYAADTVLRTNGRTGAGVLVGNLYLRGGGDVLLAAHPTAGWPAVADLDQLASALAATGVRTVRGSLIADGSAFTGPATATGWNPTYVSLGSVAPVTALEVGRGVQPGTETRAAAPALQAGAALRAALARHHIAVTGPTVPGVTPAGAITVGQVAGPPLTAVVGELLQDSDNDAAESLGRQLALATHRPATFAGAGAAIVAQLAADGLPTTGTTLADASGLSRADRVTPQLLGAVLQSAVAGPAWRPILAGLPVAHFSGTLVDRGSAPAAGDVRAKTGTLLGVNALAGDLVDASGRLLVFVFDTDHAQGVAATEHALDVLAAALQPL